MAQAPTSSGWRRLAGLLLAVAALAGCGPQTAPVASGRVCTPSTADCPSSRVVERTGPGSNLLDISLRNNGPAALVRFSVEPVDIDDDAFAGDTGGSNGNDEGFSVTYQVGSGETVSDRFVPNDIFSRKRLELTVSCAESCDIAADFVLSSEPIECESDDECGSRRCNEPTGLCVDCLEDSDCEEEQSCDTQSGRCLPPTGSGCSQAGGAPLPLSFAAFALFALLLFLERGLSARFRGKLPALLVITLLSVPTTATALRPPSSTLSVSGGPRFVTGDLGSEVKRGIGVELRETLRWKYFGTSFWIETNYFVTTQDPPPLTNELQIFGFGVAPRAYIPIGQFDLSAGAGYKRVGFAPNALVRQTGETANFNAFGGFVNGGFHFSSFVVRTGVQFYPILGADASLLSVNVAIGIATR